MDVLLLIIDSLRASALALSGAGDGVATPGLGGLFQSTTYFSRAYSADCWTLPAHMSIFSGLLPSEHGAHFQHMAYTRSSPTIAELMESAGYETEITTRNPVLDGSIPGTTRGFRQQSIVLSPKSEGMNLLALTLALSKPRFRRQVRTSGFFNARQRESREFIRRLARTTVPADGELVERLVERMREHRAAKQPFFIVANLYDIHAPYPPRDGAIFRSWGTPRHWEENLVMPLVLPLLGSHRYLEEGFSIRERHRQMLVARYHDAISLLDQKLAAFFDALGTHGLRDDLLLIVTSDHGEAFGEHGLYLHDASVWDVHLHVPLWIGHPALPAATVDSCVSTRSLFECIRRVALDGTINDTLLDETWRARHAVALAEHHYYPHAPWIAPCYRQNLRAAIGGSWKAMRGERERSLRIYNLAHDPAESTATRGGWDDYAERCQAIGANGAALRDVRAHLTSENPGFA